MFFVVSSMTSLNSNVCRIVIIGDSGVGKTALLRTYLTSGFEFSEKYSMTMGVVPSVTETKISGANDAIKFLFYDTTGSDVYYGVLPKYWVDPDMVLIIYDVSSSSSFANLNHWLELMKGAKWNQNFEARQNFMAVFANKIDLIERRVIDKEVGEKYASQTNIPYFEGSAKTNEGVSEVFQWLANKWNTGTNS